MSQSIEYCTITDVQPSRETRSQWVSWVLSLGMFASLLLAFLLDRYGFDRTNRAPVIACGVLGIFLGYLLILSDVRSGIGMFILVGCISPRMPANLRLEDALVPALVFAWLVRILRGDRFTVSTPISFPLVVVSVSMMLSFCWGLAQGAISSPLEGIMMALKRVEYGILFLFALNSIRSRADSRALLMTFLAGAVLASLIALGTAGSDSSVGDTRATGLDAENYNTFAGFLVIAASLSIAGALNYRGRTRLAFILISLLLTVTLLKTYSREGYFILAVSIAALGIMRYRILIPIVLLVSVLAQFLMPSTVIDRFGNSVNQVQNYKTETAGLNSFTARVTGWEGRWHMVEQQPIIGSGPGSVPMHIDNEYLLRLIEGGVLGLLAFLYLLVAYGGYLSICIRKLKGTEGEPFAYGLMAAFIAMLVQGVVAAAWSTIRTMEPFWILSGALGGLVVHRAYSKSVPQSAESDVVSLPAVKETAPAYNLALRPAVDYAAGESSSDVLNYSEASD